MAVAQTRLGVHHPIPPSQTRLALHFLASLAVRPGPIGQSRGQWAWAEGWEPLSLGPWEASWVTPTFPSPSEVTQCRAVQLWAHCFIFLDLSLHTSQMGQLGPTSQGRDGNQVMTHTEKQVQTASERV